MINAKRRRTTTPRITVCVSIDPKVKEHLTEKAKTDGVAVSHVIEDALTEHFGLDEEGDTDA